MGDESYESLVSVKEKEKEKEKSIEKERQKKERKKIRIEDKPNWTLLMLGIM